MTFRTLAALAVLFLLAVPLVRSADPPGPAPSREQVLKLFVEELVPLTPGEGKFPASFTMGSSDRNAPAPEKPAVKVTLKHPFAISQYEVTQELYQHVMGKNPSKCGKRTGRRNSVEMVSWDEANEFCRKLTDELRQAEADRPGRGDPPAQRGGVGIRLPGRHDHGLVVRRQGSGPGRPRLVQQEQPRATIRRWARRSPIPGACTTCTATSGSGAAMPGRPATRGPTPPADRGASPDAKERVVRGGSWGDSADASRSSFRQGRASRDTQRPHRFPLRQGKGGEAVMRYLPRIALAALLVVPFVGSGQSLRRRSENRHSGACVPARRRGRLAAVPGARSATCAPPRRAC